MMNMKPEKIGSGANLAGKPGEVTAMNEENKNYRGYDLKNLRDHLGWYVINKDQKQQSFTQTDFARLLKATTGTVSKWERGQLSQGSMTGNHQMAATVLGWLLDAVKGPNGMWGKVLVDPDSLDSDGRVAAWEKNTPTEQHEHESYVDFLRLMLYTEDHRNRTEQTIKEIIDDFRSSEAAVSVDREKVEKILSQIEGVCDEQNRSRRRYFSSRVSDVYRDLLRLSQDIPGEDEEFLRMEAADYVWDVPDEGSRHRLQDILRDGGVFALLAGLYIDLCKFVCLGRDPVDPDSMNIKERYKVRLAAEAESTEMYEDV